MDKLILSKLFKQDNLDETELCSVILNINKYFIWSCEKNHIKIAKWLHTISIDNKIIININMWDEYAFRWSCFNGHTEMVKWLYTLSLNDKKININIRNNFAFRYSCKNGHIEIVKWLYYLSDSIKINEFDDFAFRYSCKNNHLHVAKFLSELDDNYIITLDDNRIIDYKIMNKKEKLKDIIKNNKLDELYDEINEIVKDKTCPICLSEEIYHVQLYCGHNVCIKCYVYAYDLNRKCHYKCDGIIDFNDITLLKLIDFSIMKN